MSSAPSLNRGKRIENYANQNGSDWERSGEIRLSPRQLSRETKKTNQQRPESKKSQARTSRLNQDEADYGVNNRNISKGQFG